MSGEESDKDVATQAGKRSDAIQEGGCDRLDVGKGGEYLLFLHHSFRGGRYGW